MRPGQKADIQKPGSGGGLIVYSVYSAEGWQWLECTSCVHRPLVTPGTPTMTKKPTGPDGYSADI